MLCEHNERAAGVPLAVSVGVQAAICSKSGQYERAAQCITESVELLLDMASKYFGKALGREAKELVGRCLRFLAATNQLPDSQLLAALKEVCGAEELGPIT